MFICRLEKPMPKKTYQFATWNVNGIRAATQKGFLQWLEQTSPDVLCLQEVKAKPEQLDEKILSPKGYHSVWHSAQRPGYSGVAIYAKTDPVEVTIGLNQQDFDTEGRVLTLSFKNFDIISAYFPNSQRDHARLPYKLQFCDVIFQSLEASRSKGKNVIVCGDFNIAHKEIDLKNPKANRKNAGFLPEERSWMDGFVAAGYVDAFRQFEKGPDHYTWWSQRPGVRDRNIGWRLDYFFLNKEHSDRLVGARHLCDVKGSDHCPVVIDIKS